jgi:hypothetical protein
MKDKLKTLWAQMRASHFGPEPLVVSLEGSTITVETLSSFETSSGRDSGCFDGLHASGEGKTLDAALDAFSKNLDKTLVDEDE